MTTINFTSLKKTLRPLLNVDSELIERIEITRKCDLDTKGKKLKLYAPVHIKTSDEDALDRIVYFTGYCTDTNIDLTYHVTFDELVEVTVDFDASRINDIPVGYFD